MLTCLGVLRYAACEAACARGPLSLPPRLAAEHAHARHVDAYEPPRHQVLEGSQRSDKSVRVGAVGVPVSRIDSQTARAAGSGAVTRRLEEVLLLVDVVDVHVWEHRHLVAWDVCGLGFVPHPDTNTFAHRVHPSVLRGPRAPAGPSAAAPWPLWLGIRGLGAEKHPGREVVAFVEKFWVHTGDRAALLRGCGAAQIPSGGGHSLGTEEEEQDQHGWPHGLAIWGGKRGNFCYSRSPVQC